MPGGQYSRQVAEAAAATGIKTLFTSEPTTRCAEVGGCLVIGRYAIQRWMTPAVAAGMASGQFAPRFRQWLWWEIKKITKTLGGDYYLRLRESWTGKIQLKQMKTIHEITRRGTKFLLSSYFFA